MVRVFTILSLTLVLGVVSAPAQEVFEVPIELELPAAPLMIDLDNASLEVLLEARALPVLRAFPGSPRAASGAALAVTDDGRIVVRRAEPPAGAPSPRLRLELVVDPGLRLQVGGSDLEITVEGRQDDQEDEDDEEDDGDEEDDEDDGDDGDDGDDEGEDDEGEDDEGEDDDDDEDDEDDEAQPEPAVETQLSFELTGSSVDLAGVEAASLTAVSSYVHARGTRGTLILALDGSTVEIEGHQGAVELTGGDNEVTLGDVLGRSTIALTGGSLIVRGGSGHLAGRLDDALLRLEGGLGSVVVEGRGMTVEARSLPAARLEIKGEGHEIALDELEGSVVADLSGGSLAASQLRGQATITARAGTDVTMDGIVGRSTLNLEDSSARLSGVAGQVTAELRGSRLELDGVQRLELAAAGSEISAAGLKVLGKVEAADSQLDLDLSEMRSNPSLRLRGSTDARVRLKSPCSVKLGEVELLGGGAQVSGCELHSQTLNRTRHDRQGLDGRQRVVLTVTLGEDSTLEVEGTP